MFQKKICLLGAFAAGKTSLVRQFVHTQFSERYQTSLGVKVDTKVLQANGHDLTLLIWDVHGQDHYQAINPKFIKGASGYLIVIDGTRSETLDVAKEVHSKAKEILGDVPFLVLVNKDDINNSWVLDNDAFTEMDEMNWDVRRTSAKTGAHVEDVFQELANRIVSDVPDSN